MSQAKIGVAILGTGFGEKVHIPAFQAHHRTEVVSVYHRDKEKAAAIATRHQIPHHSDSLTEILTLPTVNAVSISTPPFLHYEMAKAALQAQKHLFLEKPVTLNADQAKELYHLANTHNVSATVDFEFRFVPQWQLLKEYLDQGYLGNKRLIKIDCLVPSRADENRPWNWYAQKEKGGGMLGAMASHIFDYIGWLFGEIAQLSAQLITGVSHRPDPHTGELKLVDADDTCLINLILADGTPCQICLSSVTYNGRGHWVEIYGDRATLVLGNSNLKDYIQGFQLWGALKGETLTEIPVPQRLEFPQIYSDGRIAPVIRVIDQWVHSIDHQTVVTPSLLEGTLSQLLMDLAHQSHLTQHGMQVPSFAQFIS